jgi:FKBP-type peptidyl-prolyl cis-trans isomerase FkpA
LKFKTLKVLSRPSCQLTGYNEKAYGRTVDFNSIFEVIMSRVNTLVNLSVLILGMMLLPQSAISEIKQGASNVTELIKQDTKIGSGEEAVVGKAVEVHYTGWLYDASAPDKKGKKFDSSHDRGVPFSFLLGAGRVIKGWDRGVAGMKVGGQRTLIIPPQMAYGTHGAGNVIPPNATLIFDVELLGLRQGSTH